MDNLASGTNRQFRSLLDEVAADHFGSGLGLAALGPSVGDDSLTLTTLGPSVGDDGSNAPSLTMLVAPPVADDIITGVTDSGPA